MCLDCYPNAMVIEQSIVDAHVAAWACSVAGRRGGKVRQVREGCDDAG